MATNVVRRRGWGDYFKHDLGQLPSRLRHRVFMTKTRAEMEASAAAQSKNEMKKVMSWATLSAGHLECWRERDSHIPPRP